VLSSEVLLLTQASPAAGRAGAPALLRALARRRLPCAELAAPPSPLRASSHALILAKRCEGSRSLLCAALLACPCSPAEWCRPSPASELQ
jgi:hypothetical protein